ncbi:MAG: hypothetical protein GC181_13175 [Bacteroidetes bacterium]|nr:hypothetical protein [Bacteroidota bacterium]
MKMQLKRKSTTEWVCITLMALLFLIPFVQRQFQFFHFDKLKGYHETSEKPSITLQSWFNGSYQKKFELYSADSFGFNPWLVRHINQFDFDVFHVANARYVVIGKEDYLYESAYIDEYYGRDFPGESAIRDSCLKLKTIQNRLRDLGVEFLIVLAPGKASFYPEYIPDYYLKFKKDVRCYDAYKRNLIANGIHFLDFNAWFRSMKDTSQFALFPRTGIHWSTYGMAVAGDSLQHYLAKTLNRKLPEYEIFGGEVSNEMRKSDSDIEDGMNLLRSLNHNAMYYPELRFDTSNAQPVRTAVIADSYFWGLFDHGFSNQASFKGEFWYYFREIYPQNFENGLTVDQVNLKRELTKQDVVILLATDGTLSRFGWGFIDKAYEVLK